jgi:predicted acetyltransferase
VTQTTIRRIPLQDLPEILFPLTQYAFHPSPPFRDKEKWEELIQERKDVVCLALFEDDAPVATVASSSMTQQVRGKRYDAGAVWGVVTAPAARRRGYSRRLMARLLAAEREEGQPLSCLYPFRASFYERLGYVKFPLPLKVTLDPAMLQPLLKADLGGEVERVLIGDGYQIYRDYAHRLQQRTHGMALFVHGEEERAKRENRSWLALARVDGQILGLMLYRLEGEEVTQFTMRAHRFYYDTGQAKYLLLQWIARHIDQVNEVELWLPPDQHPETWLADLHVAAESPPRAPMGRVVDVAELSGLETGPGRFAARIRDPLCPWNEGGPAGAAWAFETVDGHLHVRPTGRADCELTIQALAALVYGTHDPGDFPFRGWGDPPAEVRTTMRTMFPPRAPYLHEYF